MALLMMLVMMMMMMFSLRTIPLMKVVMVCKVLI